MIEDSRRFRESAFDLRAKRNMNWYRPQYFDNTMVHPDRNAYSVNIAYSTARTLVSSIYASDPDFSIFIKGNQSEVDEEAILQSIGETGDTIQRDKLAKCLELGLKIYMQDLRFRKINRRIITDTSVFGYGVAKLGYKINLNNKVVQDFKEKKEKGILVNDIETGDIIKNEEPYLVRVNPMDMLFPVDSVDFDRLKWVAQEIYVDVEEARRRYGVHDLKPTIGSKLDNLDSNRAGGLFIKDKVCLIEIHIMDENNPRLITIADGHKGFLQNKVHPLFNEETGKVKSMFKFLVFNDPIRDFYPQSDLDLIAPQIEEANIQINRRVENARKFTTQYQARGNWDPEDLRKFKHDEDGGIIWSQDSSATMDVIPKLQNMGEFYQNIQAIKQEALDILGLTDYQVGGSTQSRKATEAQLVEGGRRNRAGERVEAIEDFVFDEVDTMIELLRNYQETDKLFIIQYEDERIPIKLTAEVLELTDMDITIVPGSSVKLDRSAEVAKVQQAIMLSQAFAPIVNMQEVYKEGMRSLGFRNPEKYIKSAQGQQMQVPGADGRTPAAGNQTSQLPGNVNPGQAQAGGLPNA